MYEIWARWVDGSTECIDYADDKEEAQSLIQGYRNAWRPHQYVAIWKKRIR